MELLPSNITLLAEGVLSDRASGKKADWKGKQNLGSLMHLEENVLRKAAGCTSFYP